MIQNNVSAVTKSCGVSMLSPKTFTFEFFEGRLDFRKDGQLIAVLGSAVAVLFPRNCRLDRGK